MTKDMPCLKDIKRDFSFMQTHSESAQKESRSRNFDSPKTSGNKDNTPLSASKAFSCLTKKDESLLDRSMNPTTVMKRFKANSGAKTGMVNSIGASIQFLDKDKERRAAAIRQQQKNEDTATFAGPQSQKSSTEQSDDISNLKKKRGRPLGSYTSQRR